MSTKTGRNEPCKCGSGKKAKYCCDRPGAAMTPRKRNRLIIGLVLAISVGGIGWALNNLNQKKIDAAGSGSPAVPPGLTWIEADGHYHNALGEPVDATGAPLTTPPGLTWIEADGHYHNVFGEPVDATGAPLATPTPIG